jgi:subtilase family serine protease
MITTTYNSVSCASSIILDDILNGNVTLDGSSFFVGLNQFYTQLGYLNANLSSINNTMANLTPNSSNMTTITNAATTALTNIAMIPNNVNSGGNMPAVAYSTPFNSASPTSTINSIFPSILGSSTTGAYVGALYTAVSSAKTAITAISNAANNFVSETSNYQSGITQLQSTLLSFTNLIKDTDNLFYNTLSTGSTDTNYVVTGMKVLYAATIAVASLMLLGVLLISFCDKINCRYLLYFACFILFWIGLLGFALSVLFSLLTPTVYFGCQFMSYSLSSSANFNSNC